MKGSNQEREGRVEEGRGQGKEYSERQIKLRAILWVVRKPKYSRSILRMYIYEGNQNEITRR